MPESRERKKKSRSSKRPNRPAAQQQLDPARLFSPEEATISAPLLDDRGRMEEPREPASEEVATALVAELAAWAPGRTDTEVEDELCRRIGALLREWEDAPPEDGYVTPHRFGMDLVPAAADAVRTGLAAGADAWRQPWRVLTAVARVVPESADACVELVGALRRGPGGNALPPRIDQPTVRDKVLWTRDAYGSRFGVAAAFATPGGGPDRWYLWDIDTCGFKPFTVHSGFAPVDDPWLLRDLLPAEEGLLRVGGESSEQLTEYHRGKRLAEAARGGPARYGATRRSVPGGPGRHLGGRVRRLVACPARQSAGTGHADGVGGGAGRELAVREPAGAVPHLFAAPGRAERRPPARLLPGWLRR